MRALERQVYHHLADLEQLHLLTGLEELGEENRKAFYLELLKLNGELLELQRTPLDLLRLTSSFSKLAPIASPHAHRSDPQLHAHGLSLLQKGQVACVILAGGLGSRLGKNVPKGTIPVSPILNRSLFQIHLEKVRAASVEANRPLPVAIMTSPSNHEKTVAFLEEKRWFGLEKDQVSLFLQHELPYLDDEGNWLLEKPGHMAKGPDGNGYLFRELFASGIGRAWQESGVSCISVMPVDNPLADPFDPYLIGFHAEQKTEATLKCVPRLNAEEKVGLVVEHAGKIKVVEYSELPESVRHAHTFSLANTGMFCFAFSFAQRAAQLRLSYHRARKKALLLGGEQAVWKFEAFLFDVLDYAEKTAALLYTREEAFAPWKELTGSASLDAVQKMLLQADLMRSVDNRA